MSNPLKVVIFFGSVREGRMGYRVAKYVEKCFKEKSFAVDLFGKLCFARKEVEYDCKCCVRKNYFITFIIS